MKRVNNLFDAINSFENLLKAAQKAQRGKRFKSSTAVFNLNLEKELLKLQDELRDFSYKHGGYRDFFVFDPKQRLISAAPYRDRVVHHAICNVIEPIFDKTFIHDSYACRKDKGSHAALNRYTQYSRKNTFVLKCDIQKYFQSIDHKILMEYIKRKIKCQRTIRLIGEIINTRADKNFPFYFPGDDLFTPINRKKGIPIGNLTSQFFANVYLNRFDHHIKEDLKCRYYIRYVDDFVIFSDSKDHLNNIKEKIEDYLTQLRLKLHPNKSRVFHTDEGVNFLGFKIFPTHRILKKQNILYMRRRLKKMKYQYDQGEISFDKVIHRIRSWLGHAKHGDTYRMYCRLIGSVFFKRGTVKGSARRLVEQ
ncbi:MAG: group II intron reverse transcriptase domain-containing protein [Candidatus Aminicenantes bacterium]|nr:group II intron reverse transcriptase domain-containing protein [Candidatus Aminicenantes bacterium]